MADTTDKNKYNIAGDAGNASADGAGRNNTDDGASIREQNRERGKVIIRTSILSLTVNAALAAVKAVIGILSSSIAILLDAVDNTSDALSSLISIIGMKLAQKAPDKEHPLGHGRSEYISTAIIAILILYAGIRSLTESIKRIITPRKPEYQMVMLIILSVAIVIKIIMSLYVIKRGKKVRSHVLIASGKESLLDTTIAITTFAAAIIYIYTGISLEAWLGAAISLVIIRTGIQFLRIAASQMLGERIDSRITQGIRKTVHEKFDVFGVYDIILHSYGPDTLVGSLHVEVAESKTASEISELSRSIMKCVYAEYGVFVVAVGIYSVNVNDEEVSLIRENIDEIVHGHPGVLQTHGFHLDKEKRIISFDVVIGFLIEDRTALYRHIHEEIHELYPAYHVHITMDIDASD
jgi:cation diffusion facilitator family transporter